ncbi:YceI family protein [Pseudomonas sp. PCH199]|uniref:YceI family protein n=1 Tax=unclassified Pseudomonas TaxID=196821 RepID=UPI000BD931C0|nr:MULTISPECIES: YceI family protein [unclassified Pseudomonas]MCW8278837.1 YceI family protein [Pseudomonas sp. PCH199]PAM80946.1 polyisoprenoid-binding protein [Pseudomonas sp. ERMR1:02]
MSPRFLPFTALAAFLAFGVVPGVFAVQYTNVNPTASTISFTYNQMGSRVYGTFSKFEGALDFDTRHPEAAHAKLTIDLDSIDAGSSDANEELQKPAWFDTAKYPVATFESIRFKDLGNHRYQITGNLTLRGVTREVAVPVLLKAENAVGIFDGKLTLERNDFKIGEGEWANTVVSNEINIRFRMVAPQR